MAAARRKRSVASCQFGIVERALESPAETWGVGLPSVFLSQSFFFMDKYSFKLIAQHVTLPSGSIRRSISIQYQLLNDLPYLKL